MSRLRVWMAAMILLIVATAAGAQDRVGITMGYPASVGLLVRVTDSFAIRPELSFAVSSTTTTDATPVFLPSNIGSTSDTSSLGVGLSGLFYVGKRDALRTYVSPRFVYSRNSTDVTAGIASQLGLSSDVTARNYSVTGSFGAEYALGSRFAVFGEVGYGYTRTNQSARDIKSTVNATSTLTGVGVVFFF